MTQTNTKIKMNEINGLKHQGHYIDKPAYLVSFDITENNLKLPEFISLQSLVTILDLIVIWFLHIFNFSEGMWIITAIWFLIKSVPAWAYFFSNSTKLKEIEQLSFLRRKQAEIDFKTMDYPELKEKYDFNSKDGTDSELDNMYVTTYLIQVVKSIAVNLIIYALFLI